jgi:hypothetical protein
MREHELDLGQRQARDVRRVVIERARIGGDGLAPPRRDRDEREMHDERADERPLQDQARARRSQLGRDVGDCAQCVWVSFRS